MAVTGEQNVSETEWQKAKPNVNAHTREYHSSSIHMSNRLAPLIKTPAEKPVESAWVGLKKNIFYSTHESRQTPPDIAKLIPETRSSLSVILECWSIARLCLYIFCKS